MELRYHIYYRPRGQKGSQLSSLTPTNASGGFASGPFVRRLWDSMIASALAHGLMRHPDTGQLIEYAALMFGGQPDRFGNAQGGQLCRTWSAERGEEFVVEPEPGLYGADAIRARLEAERQAALAPPEQPPPSVADVTQVEIPDSEDIADVPAQSPPAIQETPKPKRQPKRQETKAVGESVSN